MGGSGGGGSIPPSSDAIRERIARARREEEERLDGEVNNLLRTFLAVVNDRDVEETQSRLKEIQAALGEDVDLSQLLFGGSVAKHTYVDGLSDVDALAVLDREHGKGLSPQAILDRFETTLKERLPAGRIESISVGQLAVTIRFRDGGEIQVLPAIKSGETISIPDARGRGWNTTDPKKFQSQLAKENARLGRMLVPTIKLTKSLIGDLPEQQRISGYHAEALCLDAAKAFKGSASPKELLTHVLDHASRRVLRPIKDVTGQSRIVDEYLGSRDSTQRRLVSQALAGVKRRLAAATSLRQWQAMFGRDEE